MNYLLGLLRSCVPAEYTPHAVIVACVLGLVALRRPFRRKALAHAPGPNTRWVIDGICSLSDAYSSILVTGGPSSGKTSTIGTHIALNLLSLGCGGLVLCAKPGEAARWKHMAALMGRADDIREFRPGGECTCDFLMSELTAKGGSETSAAHLLDMLAEMGSVQDAKGDDKFWQLSLEKFHLHAITACFRALGKSSVDHIYQMCVSAPTSRAQTKDPEWRKNSFCQHVLEAGTKKCPSDRDFIQATKYFYEEWPDTSDKTRSIVVAMVTNCASKFMTSDMRDMASSGETNTPLESMFEGRILLINMPILEYYSQAVLFSSAMKIGAQRACLRRPVNQKNKAVYIFADEAQFFHIPKGWDMKVSTVSRESRLIHVNLFQNLEMYYAALGKHAEHEVNGWMSCHMTRVALANTCIQTGEYYSKLFGGSWVDIWGGNIHPAEKYSLKEDMYGRSSNGPCLTWNSQYKNDVEPHEFGNLAKPQDDYPYSQGIIYQGGRIYPETGKPWKRATFAQYRLEESHATA